MPLVLGGIGLVEGDRCDRRNRHPARSRPERPADRAAGSVEHGCGRKSGSAGWFTASPRSGGPGRPTPTPTSAIEVPAPVEPPVPSENDATAPVGKRRGGANALRKNARAGGLRSGAGKRSQSAPEGPDSPPAPAPTAKSSNDVVIID